MLTNNLVLMLVSGWTFIARGAAPYNGPNLYSFEPTCATCMVGLYLSFPMI